MQGTDTVIEIFRAHWISAFFLGVTLTTILLMLVLRWWVMRRLRRLFDDQFDQEHELEALPSPGPLDQEAFEVIRQMRQEVWELQESELQFSMEFINTRAMRVVRSIAAVYHPDVEVPQYEASLVESIHMVRRVSTRLTRLATTTPFRYLSERRLSSWQRSYQVVQKINENPVVQFLTKNTRLSKVARTAMNIKNLGNPLYWAGKEISREGYFFMLRWFYLTLVSQVGREAMRLYSGRHFQTDEDRDAALVCYRVFSLAGEWGGPSVEEWSAFIEFVSGNDSIETDMKLEILTKCAKGRLPKNLKEQEIQTKSGVKWYRQCLKRMLDASSEELDRKKSVLGRELAQLD